ncbi:PAS domain-containing protein [Candidatus Omnitrophota bacterium]
MKTKLYNLMRKVFRIKNIINFSYILLIITLFLVVPYHNIRTGFTNWGLTGFGTSGPINAGALAVQRALTFALILFYIYNLRLKRKIRNESFEIDLAIKESEDRRHLVEKEYFKLKRQMQNLFDTMEDLVYICTKDYKIEFVNKALKKTFGERVGKKCYEILNKRKDICPWCCADRVFKGEFITLEHKLKFNNRTYLIRSSPLINPDGSVSKIAILHDVTNEREMQKEIGASKEHLEKIMETPQNLIVELDKNMIIQMFNKGCEETTGYSRSEAIGKDWVGLFIPERLRGTIRGVFEEVKSNSNIFPSQYENPILTKSKKERIILWSNTKLTDENGELISVIAIGEDITARKMSQQKIIDSEKK